MSERNGVDVNRLVSSEKFYQKLDEAAANHVTNLHREEDGDFTHEAEIFDAGAEWMKAQIMEILSANVK